MMNYVAVHLTHFLANGPLRAPGGYQIATPEIAPTARLWSLPNSATDFSAGFFLAIIAAAAVALMVRRTPLGFEIRAVGLNPDAARTAGISVPRTMVMAMTISGALAGLAGAVEVLGVHHRFYDQFSPGYGFDSIAVALLGGLNAAGVAASAILFGGLKSGALRMYAETQTPIQITGVIQAIVILATGVRYVRPRRALKSDSTVPEGPIVLNT
jgi:simple sugar transport system permease protein